MEETKNKEDLVKTLSLLRCDTRNKKLRKPFVQVFVRYSFLYLPWTTFVIARTDKKVKKKSLITLLHVREIRKA